MFKSLKERGWSGKLQKPEVNQLFKYQIRESKHLNTGRNAGYYKEEIESLFILDFKVWWQQVPQFEHFWFKGTFYLHED